MKPRFLFGAFFLASDQAPISNFILSPAIYVNSFESVAGSRRHYISKYTRSLNIGTKDGILVRRTHRGSAITRIVSQGVERGG